MVKIRDDGGSDTEVWLEYKGVDVSLVASKGDLVRTIAYFDEEGEFFVLDSAFFAQVGLKYDDE